MRVHPQENETGLEPARRIEPEHPVLIGIRRLEPRHQWPKIGQQPVQIGQRGQLVPVTKEKHHQIRAQLRVCLDHRMPRQRQHRLKRALHNPEALILDPEHHRRDRPAPAGKGVRAIGTGE